MTTRKGCYQETHQICEVNEETEIDKVDELEHYKGREANYKAESYQFQKVKNATKVRTGKKLARIPVKRIMPETR